MAVGLIISGDRSAKRSQSKREASFRIRLLSNKGLYPLGQIRGLKGAYFSDEKIAFIAVRTDEQRAHKYWSDVTFLAFEEIRFLSALLLSMRPDHGSLQFYPGGAHIIEAISDSAVLYENAKRLAREFAKETTVPLCGGSPYRFSGQKIDDKRYRQLIAKISVRDHLMLRGLSAILKADMLYVHREFGEEAQSLLFVAMEVAFQLTLRLIRQSGVEKPSALDAGQFLFSTFPNELPGRRFFEDYYDDRIRAFHPQSRFGTFAFPPMNAGDYYGLRAGLISMFQFLITSEQWYTLWS
jgi:hypothetical protein